MPTYEFACESCGRHADIVRSVKQRDDELRCLCGQSMERRVVGFRGGAHVANRAGYQPALGKSYTNNQDFYDDVRRLKYEQGIDLVEVGNEKAYMEKQKPKKVHADVKAAYEELRRLNR